MATYKDYIPRPMAEFFNFQANLVSHVADNAVAWNISPDDVTALQQKKSAYEPLYNAVINPSTKTSGAVHAQEQGRKTYEQDIRSFVNQHLTFNPAVSAQNKIDMGLNPGDTPHGPRPYIDTAPLVTVSSQGNLVVLIECRAEGDNDRPSILPDSDGVELRIAIGQTPPNTYADVPGIVFSTKARIKRILDDPNYAGQKMFVFARWKNNSDDSKSGPWSNMASTSIS